LCLQAWYLDDGTIVGDTLVVGKVLELIVEDGPRCGLHLNVDKTEIFWPKEDPRSRVEGVFPPNISRPLHGVKLLGGAVSVDFGFCSELAMKRVSKTIVLMDTVAHINDPQCELLLLRACTGISKLYFAMRTCPPRVFESAQRSFDVALRSSLERIVTASGPGFGDWQWRLATLPFAFGGLGVYSAGDVLNYAFLASRLQSAALQTKLLRHVGIVASGSTFDDALSAFNTSMDIDFLSNQSEIVAPKLMKKMADIYFTRVTKDAVSTFSLSSRQMALWQSQREDHTSNWLRAVPISGLGQTMNGRTYRENVFEAHFEKFVLYEIRLNLETLSPGLWLDANIIDCWGAILNYEERFRAADSKSRHFFPTSCIKWERFSDQVNAQFNGKEGGRGLEGIDLVFFPICNSQHLYVVVFSLTKTTTMTTLDNSPGTYVIRS
ncbi:ankyrin repeat-containing protein ITN1-like protein, partial [Tanacetum coccineum]